MKLSIGDRLNITIILPKFGAILEQMTARDIIKKTEINQEESKKVNLRLEKGDKPENDLLKWDTSKDDGKEIEFTSTEISFLKEQVDRLDKDKNISAEVLGLCLLIREQK